MFVFASKLVTAVLEVIDQDAKLGNLSIKAGVLAVQVGVVPLQLVHTASEVSVDRLGVLQALGQVLDVGLGLEEIDINYDIIYFLGYR